MTKIYDGSGKTTYTLNSGRVIVLNDEEFDELVVGSEKIKGLHDNIVELELEMACKNRTINRLEYESENFEISRDGYMDELIELKNRNCANCNFYHQGYVCLENGDGNFKPSSDFYCNKWKEVKSENNNS